MSEGERSGTQEVQDQQQMSADSHSQVQMRSHKKSRFAKRKKERAKRARSDGFVLGQQTIGPSDDEDDDQDNNTNKPEESDATLFLWWIRNPTVQSLGKLCRAIKSSDVDWMKEFLEFDGLGLLFQCLRQLTEVQSPHLTDMVLRMECIMCIREVANSKIGLDCLLTSKHRRDNIFGRRFAAVLENRNAIVKIQIFELMSALCLYSKDGYYLTLDALEKYKSWQKYQYRFSLLLNELRHADHDAYRVNILALINAIIFANENIQDRMRIRNEFLALNIEETVAAVCESNTNPDFQIQWEVFQDEMTADREAIEETKEGLINVNNHQELFQAIFNRVRDSPISAAFLSILQSMFQINASLTQSEPIWNLLEREVRNLLENDPSFPSSLNSSRRSSITSMISNSVSLIPHTSVQFKDEEVQTEAVEEEEKAGILSELHKRISSTHGEQQAKDDCSPKKPGEALSEAGRRTTTTNKMGPPSVPPPPPPLPPFLQAQPSPSSVPPPPPLPPLPPSLQPQPSTPSVPTSPPLPPFLQSHPSPPSVPPPPPPPPPLPPFLQSHPPAPSVPPPPPPPPPLPPFLSPVSPDPTSAPKTPGLGTRPPPTPPPPPPPLPTISVSGAGGPLQHASPLSPNNPGQTILHAPQQFFPQIAIPEPKCKMRPFSWNKVQPTTISDVSVWNDVLKMKEPVEVEFKKLQELFCQKENTEPEKEKTPIKAIVSSEITLIDPKKSMNLNIFLKQFRRSNEEIIEMIKKADVRAFGVEKLKGLIKLLPQQDEIDLIENFDGNLDKLGTAEKFYRLLIQLPAFRCRLDAMLLVGDFSSQLAMIRPNIHLLNTVCGRLTDNASLKKFLRLILHAGNFLNKGTSSGNAVGFRINSLNKLVMIRSNVARLSLLHHLVEQAQNENKDALKFVDELLEPLQKASRINLENIKFEFKQLQMNVTRVHRQLENVAEEVAEQFKDFLEDSESDLEEVQVTIDRLDARFKRLAQHFCENERTFKPIEFLESFREFCEKVKNCQQENLTRVQLAKKAEQRKKAQAEIVERRKGLVPNLEDRKIVDNLVNEIRRGKVLRRLSMRKKTNLVAREKEINV